MEILNRYIKRRILWIIKIIISRDRIDLCAQLNFLLMYAFMYHYYFYDHVFSFPPLTTERTQFFAPLQLFYERITKHKPIFSGLEMKYVYWHVCSDVVYPKVEWMMNDAQYMKLYNVAFGYWYDKDTCLFVHTSSYCHYFLLLWKNRYGHIVTWYSKKSHASMYKLTCLKVCYSSLLFRTTAISDGVLWTQPTKSIKYYYYFSLIKLSTYFSLIITFWRWSAK